MITNPWVMLGALMALLLAITGAYLRGHSNGVDHERSLWVQKENKALTDANNKIIELTEKARAAESLNAVKIASISNQYEQDKLDGQAKTNAIIANIRANGLRVPIVRQDSSASPACSAATSPSQPNDSETAELPRQVSEDIVRLLNEADDTARQVTGLQKLVIEDRNLCQ